MKIKIIFVVIAVVFAAVGGLTGSFITNKADKIANAEIAKLYQAQIKDLRSDYDELRGDYNSLAKEARYKIEQKLYIRKVKNGQVVYEPTSTMEISKLMDKIDSTLNNKPDSLTMNPIIPKKSFWEKLKFW